LELFLTYLKSPIYIKNEKINWSHFFQLFILYFLISLIIGLLIGILKKTIGFYDTELNYNIFKIFIAGTILGPIVEEISFRLILKPSYKNFIFLTFFFILLSAITLIRQKISYLIVFLTLGVISFIIWGNKVYLKKIQILFLKRFSYVFYISCFLFGMVHITNYTPLNYKVILIFPILILSQIIGGAFFGYIRMKFGIVYSILFHSIFNFPPFLILVFNSL
jgi:membrane protease YdiL (CAAX protease family)